MRTEEQVRDMYKRYVNGHAKAKLSEKEKNTSLIFYGAAIACGRTLGKDMKRIKMDLEIAQDHYRRVGL